MSKTIILAFICSSLSFACFAVGIGCRIAASIAHTNVDRANAVGYISLGLGPFFALSFFLLLWSMHK